MGKDKGRRMKEYIFARPKVVTLKEAMHDAYFRGEVIRCKDCLKKDICSMYRQCKDDYGYCSWAKRKEE